MLKELLFGILNHPYAALYFISFVVSTIVGHEIAFRKYEKITYFYDTISKCNAQDREGRDIACNIFCILALLITVVYVCLNFQTVRNAVIGF